MVVGNLLALLDDIATTLDDIAVMTKTAATKSAGVAGDDLAVGAGQVTGSPADREIPIVMKVMKGSFINKAIIVPVALLISAFAPSLINIILFLGGVYLCIEGAEKILHIDNHGSSKSLSEADKIKGAIATDMVLSIEIIVIALAAIASQPLWLKAATLVVVAVVMTLGIYMLVLLIVKLDDFGFFLNRKFPTNPVATTTANGLISAAPYLMKFLAIVGTAAMLGVAGSIFTHTLPALHHLEAEVLQGLSPLVQALTSGAICVVIGLVVGVIAVSMIKLGSKVVSNWNVPNPY